jgi:Cysteine rich repeat
VRAIRYMTAAVVAAGLAVSPAAAQTISYQQAVEGLSKACGADIDRSCKGVNLGDGRIFDCLQKNSAKVSENCKTAYAFTAASIAKRAAAQDAAPQLCATDIKRFCKEYDAGNGRIMRCLLSNTSKLDAPCNQAITDAGWR